ncbi:MAG TPA: hypothetical protein VF509_09970 [Sphingobium sp.]
MRRSTQPPIIRFSEQPASASAVAASAARDTRYQFILGGLAVLAVCYNGLLAMAGAFGLPISATSVLVIEPLILVSALLAILRISFTRDDLPSLLLAFAFLAITIYLSAINEVFFPDTMRNMAIIALFTMLGLRAKLSTVNMAVLVTTLLTAIVLVIEVADTPLYVQLFQPAQYFFKTRGLEIPDWDKSGLFGNALGFKERFSFGLTAHRTSSIFLEQVSMANFAAFLTVYLMSLWPKLATWRRIFFIVVIVAVLVTNNTRTSLILAVIAPAGYFLYPRMPRYLNVAIAPLLIFVAWFIEDPNRPYADDFAGRLSLTIRTLMKLDLEGALGQKIMDSYAFVDSGYPYFIYAATLPGLILLWMFISFYLPQRTAAQKRFAYASGLFIACSLVVAGTSIFTIKVASMLWFLAGFMRTQRDERDEKDGAEPVEAEPIQTASPRPFTPRRPAIAGMLR